MSPIEDFNSRDLEWMQEFILQQIIMMLRPMMEHLQQTDATVDYSQRAIQRVSMDVAEVRDDLVRTNKYLAVLRQGLGIQNEGKAQLQLSLDAAMRSAKQMEEQVEGVLGVTQGAEESIAMLTSTLHTQTAKAEELEKQVARNSSTIDELRAGLDKCVNDSRFAKDGIVNTESRMDMLQRDFRRAFAVPGVVPMDQKPMAPAKGLKDKLAADPWSQKHRFGGPTPESSGGSSGGIDARISREASRAMGRKGSNTRAEVDRGALSQDVGHSENASTGVFGSSQGGVSGLFGENSESDEAKGGTPQSEQDGSSLGGSGGARLPLLVRPPGSTRPHDSAYAAGPRLRFTQTMNAPPSRGTPRGTGSGRHSSVGGIESSPRNGR